jgi:hypothetical protein
MGDVNVRVECGNASRIIGKFEQQERNDNGERLLGNM